SASRLLGLARLKNGTKSGDRFSGAACAAKAFLPGGAREEPSSIAGSFSAGDHDRRLDQADVDGSQRDQLGIVRQGMWLTPGRVHPVIGSGYLVDAQGIDRQLVLLKLHPEEVLVILDAQCRERLLRVHAGDDSREHPVETPQ